MHIEDLLKANWKEILKIAARHDARNILIFGSVARGEADSKIDLDILWNSFRIISPHTVDQDHRA